MEVTLPFYSRNAGNARKGKKRKLLSPNIKIFPNTMI
jgi:hypothetical protein